MNFQIALIRGDGVGPEIIESAVQVLKAVGEKTGHDFTFTDYLAGGCAIDAGGHPLPQETVDGCLASDSVLLGAVGGPKWESLPGDLRPERALLGLRSAMGLYANLRPATLFPQLAAACPLRAEAAARGFDLLIVRELTGGIYYGERGRRKGTYGPEAYDTERYSVMEIERIGRVAFEAAKKRGGRLISVDKANVLETSRLWRETMHRLAGDYPEVDCRDMLVDSAAMQLIRDPTQFDVMVCSNMFGDILSDEASQLAGSIGLLPSASLGDTTRGLFEPIHGSAPDIAGQDKANPMAAILSAAMLLRYGLGLSGEAEMVERAVSAVLSDGWRTADIAGPGCAQVLGCRGMTEKIIAGLS